MQSRILALVVLMLVLPAMGSLAWGSCYVAEVPGTIVLPDDSEVPAGRLEICLTRMYTPVSGLHRTAIDGRVSGLFLSRKISEEAEDGDQRPYFVFVRVGETRYELDSYALSDGRTLVTYEMRPTSVRSRWQVRRAEVQAAPQKKTRVVLIASLAGVKR